MCVYIYTYVYVCMCMLSSLINRLIMFDPFTSIFLHSYGSKRPADWMLDDEVAIIWAILNILNMARESWNGGFSICST